MGTRYEKGDYFGPRRFEIIDIFTGGFSEVYKAKLGKEIVAYKTIKEKYINLLNDSQYQDLLKEGSNWIQIGFHPNIVKCNFVGIFHQQPYLELEWVDGKYPNSSLRAYMRNEKINFEDALLLSLGILRGLLYSQSFFPNLIHRDIKPENILVDSEGIPKVSDFGLARFFDKLMSNSEEHLAGTPQYMSPELWQNATVTIKSDIYALGCVFYELFYHHILVEGMSISEIRKKHLDDKEVKWNDDKKEINEIIKKCIEINPSNRFDTLQEIEEELYKFPQIRKANIKYTSQSTQSLYWDLMNKGLSQKTAHNYDKALNYYNQALQEAYGNSEFAHIYSSFGTLYTELNRFNKAVAHYKKALNFINRDSTLYWPIKGNLGIAYAGVGDANKALEILDEVIPFLQDQDHLLFIRAKLYVKLQRYDDAIIDLEESIQLMPYTFNKYQLLGRVYLHKGDPEETIRIFKFAANKFRSNSMILIELIYLLLQEDADTNSAFFYFERYEATDSSWKSVAEELLKEKRMEAIFQWVKTESRDAKVIEKAINFFLNMESLDHIRILLKVYPFIIDNAFISMFEDEMAKITHSSQGYLRENTKLIIDELKHLSTVVNCAKIILSASSDSDLTAKFERHIKALNDDHLANLENVLASSDEKTKIDEGKRKILSFLKSKNAFSKNNQKE